MLKMCLNTKNSNTTIENTKVMGFDGIYNESRYPATLLNLNLRNKNFYSSQALKFDRTLKGFNLMVISFKTFLKLFLRLLIF